MSVYSLLPLFNDPSRALYVYDDFLGNARMFASAGSSVTYISTGTPGRPGALRLSTSTSSSGSSNVSEQGIGVTVLFGGGEAIFETSSRIVTLSDGTETFIARLGWVDSTSGDGVDGAFFRYTHSVNSGNWVLVARNNNVETAINSSIAATANTWQRLRIVVNAAGTSAEFFVDGVSAGTVTSNIPTSAGRETGIVASITKSAGTTARTLDLDYLLHQYNFTTQR